MGLETLAIMGAVGTLAGGGMSAIGSIQQGNAQAAQAKYQAQIAQNNQKIAGWQAEDALERGEIERDRQRQRNSLQRGTVIASLASQGTDIGSGSPLDIIGDVAEAGELDVLTLKSNAEREAWGFRNQGRDFGAEAGLLNKRAGFATTAGYMGAASSLLAGASSAATGWAKWKRG